jgi:hypothetical protein
MLETQWEMWVTVFISWFSVPWQQSCYTQFIYGVRGKPIFYNNLERRVGEPRSGPPWEVWQVDCDSGSVHSLGSIAMG